MSNIMNTYTVQKGDTLSRIAERVWGDKMAYDKIAGYNGLKDPDKIDVGQKIDIPTVDKHPLKFSQIPTKNKIQVIDNYSPNYNYIIEGNKVYYALKGKDHWVDISENNRARKNLLKFLNDKYQFRGYEDGEAELYKRMSEPKTQEKTLIQTKQNFTPIITIPKVVSTLPSDNTRVVKPFHVDPKTGKSIIRRGSPINQNERTVFGDLVDTAGKYYNHLKNTVKDYYILGKNYINRQLAKASDSDEATSSLKYEDTYQAPNSKYIIQPGSVTGDTLFVNKKVNPREYYLPESINLGDVRLGARNRGDYTPLHSEGAIVTSLYQFMPYAQVTDKTGTYFGIDKAGRFKAGPYSEFGDGDMMARTYANNVESFVTDNSGKILTKDDAQHDNPGRRVPIVNVINDKGVRTRGSINILTNKGDTNTGTYGTITGGRVVMRAGNETRLVSGSIDNIKQVFEELKQRNNVPYVTFYTLDNGTFNRGLRMTDQNLTSRDLKNHDLKNSGGGNFLYLLPQQSVFPSDTVKTSNVRTTNDESFKKGHPVKNSVKGIVNHHTGEYPGGFSQIYRDFESSHGTDNARSAHVVIEPNGTRHILATPTQVTFHGGYSRWNGQNNVNDFMIGVEFQGDTNRKPLTDQQIQSYVEYVKPIIRQYGIPYENIVTHQNVRDDYNRWAQSNGLPTVPSKPDINRENQQRLLAALRRAVFIERTKTWRNPPIRSRKGRN